MAERSRLTERLADSMAAAEQAAEAPCASPCELPGSAHFQRVGVEAAAAAEALNANVAAEGRATRLARVRVGAREMAALRGALFFYRQLYRRDRTSAAAAAAAACLGPPSMAC